MPIINTLANVTNDSTPAHAGSERRKSTTTALVPFVTLAPLNVESLLIGVTVELALPPPPNMPPAASPNSENIYLSAFQITSPSNTTTAIDAVVTPATVPK